MGLSSSILLPIPTSSGKLDEGAEGALESFGHSADQQRSQYFESAGEANSDEGSGLIDSLSSARDDLRSGFLPNTPPLSRLDGPWAVWEDALEAAQGLELGHGEVDPRTKRWRRIIREELEVIETVPLAQDLRRLRRAHLVLAFLMHFYVHSDKLSDVSIPSQAATLIPKGIAVPLCAVSKFLDLPPVLTYSDTVLYNWQLINPSDGFTPQNVKIQTTFTGTDSEAHFYKTSFLVEVLGFTCLSLMNLTIEEAAIADRTSVSRIASMLLVLSSNIERIREVVEKVRDGCDPGVFYWQIRPWFHGGKREMEGVSSHEPDEAPQRKWLVSDFGGPSAGQSTLVHALDVFLGVDHRPSPASSSSPSTEPATTSSPSGEETFMERMAAYMPYHHRRFLSQLASSLSHASKLTTFPVLPHTTTHSVRSLALASPPTSDLCRSYNECVAALGRLRSSHSRIALLYIVSQARNPPPDRSASFDSSSTRQSLKSEPDIKDHESAHKTHVGTGGTDLAKFLKRCRERTSNALI